MEEITRLKSFMVFALFFLLGVFSLFFGCIKVREYFTLFDVILVSKFDMVVVLVSFVFFIISYPALYFFVKNKTMPIKKIQTLTKVIVLWFFLSVLGGFVFFFLFTMHLEKVGYIQCKGIPTGSMPGMTTKFALSQELCSKKSF